MKLNIRLFLTILTLFTSCNGQASNQERSTEHFSEQFAKGDTVKELGSSIMVIYQDKKNIYWFGSWETGVYRYDGKTFINYTTKHGLPNNRIDEIKEDNSGNIYFNSCYPHSTITKFDGQAFSTLTAFPSNDWKLESNDLWFKYSYQTEKCIVMTALLFMSCSFLSRLKFPILSKSTASIRTEKVAFGSALIHQVYVAITESHLNGLQKMM